MGDQSWTAGNDSCLSHRKLLGFGGFGSVHEVGFREIFTNAHVDGFFSGWQGTGLRQSKKGIFYNS